MNIFYRWSRVSSLSAASLCNESSSSLCYLLQVLHTALILVHVQVHKADLRKRANTANEGKSLAVLFGANRNQLEGNDLAVLHKWFESPMHFIYLIWHWNRHFTVGFCVDFQHRSHNSHWSYQLPSSFHGPRNKYSLCIRVSETIRTKSSGL